MNTVIMAAGSQAKWGGYLGVPQHLVDIDGEPLLHRTIRQVRERSDDLRLVTVPSPAFFGELDAVEYVGHDDCAMDCFVNSPLVPPTRFIVGDVYFTDAAMDTVFACDEVPMFFGRAEGNGRKVYGELFAVTLDATSLVRARALRAIHATLPRCCGWELYRSLCGFPLTEHRVGPHFTEIDDDTDDFDYPHDYDRWLEARGRA